MEGGGCAVLNHGSFRGWWVIFQKGKSNDQGDNCQEKDGQENKCDANNRRQDGALDI